MDNYNNDDQEKVVFHEDDAATSRKFSLFRNLPERGELENSDRIISLLIKVSGGRIKSKKIATYIVVFLVIVMFAISIVSLFQ